MGWPRRLSSTSTPSGCKSNTRKDLARSRCGAREAFFFASAWPATYSDILAPQTHLAARGRCADFGQQFWWRGWVGIARAFFRPAEHVLQYGRTLVCSRAFFRPAELVLQYGRTLVRSRAFFSPAEHVLQDRRTLVRPRAFFRPAEHVLQDHRTQGWGLRPVEPAWQLAQGPVAADAEHGQAGLVVGFKQRASRRIVAGFGRRSSAGPGFRLQPASVSFAGHGLSTRMDPLGYLGLRRVRRPSRKSGVSCDQLYSRFWGGSSK